MSPVYHKLYKVNLNFFKKNCKIESNKFSKICGKKGVMDNRKKKDPGFGKSSVHRLKKVPKIENKGEQKRHYRKLRSKYKTKLNAALF